MKQNHQSGQISSIIDQFSTVTAVAVLKPTYGTKTTA